jgi:hypothetical protein
LTQSSINYSSKFFEDNGLPDSLVRVIEKLYSNCKVRFECNGIKEAIDYSTGVQQGDNMSPVLFLCIMQTFLDTIKDEIPPIRTLILPRTQKWQPKNLKESTELRKEKKTKQNKP